MFLIVLLARWMPLTTASSKLLDDEAMISVTLATDMTNLLLLYVLRIDLITRRRRQRGLGDHQDDPRRLGIRVFHSDQSSEARQSLTMGSGFQGYRSRRP